MQALDPMDDSHSLSDLTRNVYAMQPSDAQSASDQSTSPETVRNGPLVQLMQSIVTGSRDTAQATHQATNSVSTDGEGTEGNASMADDSLLAQQPAENDEDMNAELQQQQVVDHRVVDQMEAAQKVHAEIGDQVDAAGSSGMTQEREGPGTAAAARLQVDSAASINAAASRGDVASADRVDAAGATGADAAADGSRAEITPELQREVQVDEGF